MRKVFYLLGALSDSDVEWLFQHGHRRRLPSGTVLVRTGEAIDALYILLDGTLEVTFPHQAATETVKLFCGEVVGEISFIDSRTPTATVTATSAATVLAIPRRDLTVKLQS